MKDKLKPGQVRTVVIGTGAGLPDQVLTNFDLEKMVDTSDQWIIQRTGIRERRIAAAGESTITFALKAGRQALEEAGLDPNELDLIVVGTQTPDMNIPSTACLLQKELGAANARAFDLKAGCTGWLYSLVVADNFIRVNPDLKILVVGAEILSRVTDWEDRSTCVLFGDAAGATLVTGSSNGDGLLSTCLKADGTQWEALTLVGGGTIHGFTREMVDKKLWAVRMEGNKVFKIAVPAMEEVAWHVLTDAGYSPADVDWLIPHQANRRIMDAVAQRLGLPMEKVIVNVDKYGNTSTASIPVALAEATREGRIRRGDLVLMVSFGGGFT
ncbi:MAG: beta-ketoacyl-ACP synthase III, partial [Thermodesulfobacteriota bacterium]